MERAAIESQLLALANDSTTLDGAALQKRLRVLADAIPADLAGATSATQYVPSGLAHVIGGQQLTRAAFRAGEISADEEMSAAHKVFSTYELAEMIYTNLPLLDVLRTMGVDRNARHVMQRSQVIFRSFCAMHKGQNYLENPFRRYIDFTRPARGSQREDFYMWEHRELGIPIDHSLLRIGYSQTDRHEDHPLTVSTILLGHWDKAADNESWRCIPITDPTTQVQVTCMPKVGVKAHNLEATLPAGATLGDLYKCLCDMGDRFEEIKARYKIR